MPSDEREGPGQPRLQSQVTGNATSAPVAVDTPVERPPLAIASLNDFLYGRAPHPLVCGRGLELGKGQVIPEVNFTLPPIEINEENWPEIRKQYAEMIDGVCQRAVELEVPGLLVEFEALPEMTTRPEWGLEITRVLAEALRRLHDTRGLRTALRLTPNDTRELRRPPLMRRGEFWEGMLKFFDGAGNAGADLLSIESTGGKEVSDEALLNVDLRVLVFALGVLAARDMQFLWQVMVGACRDSGVIPAGDTACGFANTAMVLAEQSLVPRVFAALVRVAAVPRSLVAYETGAVGPSKDCAYEGPYMKAIAGVPISMEGRTAACAHLSHVGNIAQAVCDCWSNESVQNVRLLSTFAPTVSLEQLAYDCRLLNTAAGDGKGGVRRLRDWLVESDAGSDPQAWVLRPDVVLRISKQIVEERNYYRQTHRAIRAALAEIKGAHDAGQLRIPAREVKWLGKLQRDAEALPDREEELVEEVLGTPLAAKFLPESYGLDV
jgi:methanol---5-hydroxybenzimidazolylcobamide Co-methyltransferase